ncbi:MAG TPA: FixH family protein [Beijerinckiaceae bacterium]|nr:FixH family protein [Beijerinckiaceae bacterium]
MPVDLSPANQPQRKEWTLTGRFVLICLVTFFVVVAAVNAVMMTLAIRTFPGIDARNGYEVSQRFNQDIAAARTQSERGWGAESMLERAGEGARVRLALTQRDGRPVTGLAIEARLRHPSDRRLDQVLALSEAAPGQYEGVVTALSAGAWGLDFDGRTGGETVYRLVSRVTLKN